MAAVQRVTICRLKVVPVSVQLGFPFPDRVLHISRLFIDRLLLLQRGRGAGEREGGGRVPSRQTHQQDIHPGNYKVHVLDRNIRNNVFLYLIIIRGKMFLFVAKNIVRSRLPNFDKNGRGGGGGIE